MMPARSMAYSTARRNVRLAKSGLRRLGTSTCTVGKAYASTDRSSAARATGTSQGLSRPMTEICPLRRATSAAVLSE